jgi:hypothetical protein
LSERNYPDPKWLYHWDGKNRRSVVNREEEAALRPDWFESSYLASEELNRRLDAIKALPDLSEYEHYPDVIDAYFKREYARAQREEKWAVIREYNTHFPHVLVQFTWASTLVKNMPSEMPTPKDRPGPLVWLGTARAWGDMVLKAYSEDLIKASSPLNALEQAAEHYVWQESGKPSKAFNPRAVWQSLKNRDDYLNPTKPGPR